MGKFLAFALLIIAVLAGLGAYSYFSYEKPKQQETKIEFHNVSISASEAHSLKRIIANYSIVRAGESFSGQTLRDSYSVQRIPTNGTFEVITYAPGYYTAFEVPSINYIYPQNVRIDSILDPIGNLSITPEGRLGMQDNISLRLSVNGLIKTMKVCLRWSNNIISAQLEGLIRDEPPNRLINKVDKCYRLDGRLRNSNSTILSLHYAKSRPLTPDDEIKIHFLYGNILPASQKQEVFEDERQRPVGKDDVVIILAP